MKGTLFSADFVKDVNGNIRLLELNTDTGITTAALNRIDYDAINAYITGSNITKITTIGKSAHHKEFVDAFETNISNACPSVTEFNKIYEPLNAIYPTVVSDEADRLILRLAYDESAVFDSTYCKEKANVYNLFVSQSTPDSSSIAEYYYSSSADGVVYDYIAREVNAEGNVPDAAYKLVGSGDTSIDFYRFEPQGSSSRADAWDSFIESNYGDGHLLTKYHFYNSGSFDNKVHSLRSLNIILGTDLDIVNLTTYHTPATFELPTDISSELPENTGINKLHIKHFYEYATNYVKFNSDVDGIYSEHKVIKADDSAVEIQNINTGDIVKSYFISGSPDTDDYQTLFEWSSTGPSFPSGSYVTSSTVISKTTEAVKYNALNEIVVDGDPIYVGTNKSFLVYTTSSNAMSYKAAVKLDPSDDYFIDLDGDLLGIDSASVFITNDETTNVTEIDVEDTDTYIISGSTAFNSIVSHNAPCFVGGTEILLANGDVKLIENIVVGDVALTFNHDTNEVEEKEVEQVISKRVNKTVKYTFENGKTLQCTVDHPLYCNTCDSYCAFDPELAYKSYGLKVGQLEAGMELKTSEDSSLKISSIEEVEESVVVYNLNKVEGNHNFYANGLLAHNRGCFVAGSLITLDDGTTAPIEKIRIDDAVLTYNEAKGENESGKVGDLKVHEVGTIVRLTLENSIVITTTPEHPFFVIGKGYVKAADLEFGDECLKSDGSNSFISTKEIIEETHTVYNLLDVSENHNFYVNDILVHNKA